MIIHSEKYDLNTFEMVRAQVIAQRTAALAMAKEQGGELCTCGVGQEAKIAGLSLEQTKGFAIGLTVAIESMLSVMMMVGADSFVGKVMHELIHTQQAAVKLAGTDDEFNDIELPL